MERSGLAVLGEVVKIPLKSVKITGDLCLPFARISIVQCYENTADESIEAVYTFPVPDTAVVLGFTARTGERTIKGEIRKRDEAFQVYRDALESGDGAVLLEQHRPNIFQISVGHLLPGDTVEVEISYLEELQCQDRELRLAIPMVVAPRYIPGIKTGEKRGPGSAEPTDRVPDADFITPVVGDADYRATLDLRVLAPKSTLFDSPSHSIRVDWIAENTARITFAGTSVAMDSDFVLICTLEEEIGGGGAIYSKDGQEKLLHLIFLPELEPQHPPGGKTYLFVIDISGSMMGEKLRQAKSALLLCLRNLVAGDSFNIIAFNHACTGFSKKVVPFDQQSLDRAGRWIESLQASGGTEILEPLAFCLKDGGGFEDGIILFFTDGQVGNEQEVLAFAKRRLRKGRIFTFGIDTAVNGYFLNELARVGRGRAEFIYPGERIDEKVVRQFSRIVSPFVEEVQIEWGGNRVEDLFPRRIDIIYDMEPLHVFARIKGEPRGKVMLRGRIKGKDGDTVFESGIDLNTLPRCGDVDLPEKAWAHRVIRELERELDCMSGRKRNKIAAEIERLSLEHGIISSLTSFVAVEERLEKVSGLPVKRLIPVSPPREWRMFEFSHIMPLYRAPLMLGKSLQEEMPVNLLEADVSCFSAHPGVNLYEQSAPAAPGTADLFRILARKQMADGVFADGETHNLRQKLKTTALSLLAFLLGKEDISIYLNQLRKAHRFILEVLEAGKICFDVESEADAELCLLLCLALKRSLLRGIVKRKERDAVKGLVGRLEEALENAARVSGRIGRVMEEAEHLERPESAAIVLDFLGVSGSGMPEAGDWENLPPSALARCALLAISKK